MPKLNHVTSSIDVTVNVICVLLSYPQSNNLYYCCCKRLHMCCKYIVSTRVCFSDLTINESMMETNMTNQITNQIPNHTNTSE